MSNYELRVRLSKGEINSEEFTKIIMAMQAREDFLSKSYPKHMDQNKKPNTRGFAGSTMRKGKKCGF